ncbi:MAG: hypothetical protein BM556_03250 [Bacteriovorax sp. MedPE-SWde]|nr:MAG: hypothetical protein BM556_03250 [Bacteriovorax sp. MedPE-SWde]
MSFVSKLDRIIKISFTYFMYILVLFPISIFWRLLVRKNTSWNQKTNSDTNWNKVEKWSHRPQTPF